MSEAADGTSIQRPMSTATPSWIRGLKPEPVWSERLDLSLLGHWTNQYVSALSRFAVQRSYADDWAHRGALFLDSCSLNPYF